MLISSVAGARNLWKGKMVLQNWNDHIVLLSGALKNVSFGDKITVTITDVTGTGGVDDYPIVVVKTSTKFKNIDDWPLIATTLNGLLHGQKELEFYVTYDILEMLPSIKQRILLSATDSEDIPAFVGTRDYVRLNFLDEETDDRISLLVIKSPEKDKLQTLYRLLCTLGTQKSLVFVGYRESVERVGGFLEEQGIMADIFHGGMEQRDRERALYRFMNGSVGVLVSTDLASRGLDITDVDNIIHYHLPLNEEACTHRNGRTARWDMKGSAYFILGPEESLPSYIVEEVETVAMPTKIPKPAKPLWITLYIGKGKKDKISRGDIVGFLTKQGGLESSQIGRIDVLPHWSYVAVERASASKLLKDIKGLKIKGQKTIYALAGH